MLLKTCRGKNTWEPKARLTQTSIQPQDSVKYKLTLQNVTSTLWEYSFPI